MEKVKLVCITCPIGCNLDVEVDDGKVVSVCGNSCKRGITYAEAECLNPTRVLTACVKTSDGRMLSVKTQAAIAKDKIIQAVGVIYATSISSPVEIGDVIIEDILGSGVDVVATKRLV